MLQGISTEGSKNTTNHLSLSQQCNARFIKRKEATAEVKCRKEKEFKEYTEYNFLTRITEFVFGFTYSFNFAHTV
jgi:hypothetical protein